MYFVPCVNISPIAHRVKGDENLQPHSRISNDAPDVYEADPFKSLFLGAPTSSTRVPLVL